MTVITYSASPDTFHVDDSARNQNHSKITTHSELKVSGATTTESCASPANNACKTSAKFRSNPSIIMYITPRSST